jgi:heptosyltransferase-2
MNNFINIAVVYSHSKLGDLVWQTPYFKSISEYHNAKITLIVHPDSRAKQVLKDESYINKIHYNSFRKKIWYFIEIFKIYHIFKKEKFSHIYILDKISRPAIAATFANIPNRAGPGIRSQKKWLTSKNFLSKKDYEDLNYSEQSEKILSYCNILVKNKVPNIYFSNQSINNIKINFDLDNKKIVSFGVDSSEILSWKNWYEDQFSSLANKLYESKIVDKVCLIASPANSHVVDKIIDISKNKIFFDCSNTNLLQIIKILKKSLFFVGNNSGPLNLSAALGTKSFGLIANDKVSELSNTRIEAILPENYQNKVFKNREGMRKLTVEKVFHSILKKIN